MLRTTFVLALVLSSLGIVGCPASGDDGGAELAIEDRIESDPRIFHRSLGEPEYLDPGLMSESEGGVVTADTFEGLYSYGPSEREFPNGVAESHETSADGKTYTFRLRKNAKWSDGTPVTAHDFEYSWKRVLDPATASRYASLLYLIKGAREYNSNTGPRDGVQVRATDDHTLEVVLQAPAPHFIGMTAFYTFIPVPKHVIEEHGDAWSRPENIVSNGPWKTVEWESKVQIVAEQNPHYWDRESLPFDKIVYHITENNEPAYNQYLEGRIDFLEGRVPDTVIPKLIRERHPDHKRHPLLSTYYYQINTKRPQFSDVRVRQALNMAIDKSLIGTTIIRGGQLPATTMVPPGLPGYDYPTGPGFDPKRARALLAEAGYPKGEGFPQFEISYNTMEGHKKVAEFIQDQWKKNLGISCVLQNMEWKVLIKKQQNGDIDISRSAWIGDYLDPMTFLELFEGDNENNRTGYDDDVFDRHIANALSAPTRGERMQELKAADEKFLADMPGIPIYYYVRHSMVKPWLEGFQPHLMAQNPSRYFTIVRPSS